MTQLAFNLTEPWLPDNFKLWHLTEEELRVYEALYYHQGAQSAVRVQDLAIEAFPFRSTAGSERITRNALKTLTEDRKVAIATSTRPPYGCYLITDPDELIQYTTNLTARAMSMLRRAASLKKISLPVFLGQIRADLDDAK